MSTLKTLGSTVVYQNKWMTVKEDDIERPSGARGIYSVVEKPDFVVILPIQDQSIYLVEQYRYPVSKRCWELPQGSWEETPNIDPKQLAASELHEETGLIAGTLTHVATQYLAYGFCNQRYHIYLATNLRQDTQNLDIEEEDLICKAFTLAEFQSMILEGKIQDATTVNAFGLAKLKGLLGDCEN